MTGLYEQHKHNVSPGPCHEGRDALPASRPAAYPVRYIAYYLPQFHAIPENDEWWGAGFTEWTNVTKALPRYVGHYQPRLPADLGFYDLRSVAALERQAELAGLGGIYGFCIHHYWFAGRQVLETPLRLLLENRHIPLRFCINWANENWSRRWDGSEQDILLAQRYSPDDDLALAASLLPAIEDERYIRIDGRPLLMLYRPGILPDARATIERWREYFIRHGAGDPYVTMPQAFGDNDPRKFGADAAAGFPPHNGGWERPDIRRGLPPLDPAFSGRVVDYDNVAANALANRPEDFRLFPGVCPDWDNEARKPARGFNCHGSTPQKYGAWLRAASALAMRAPSPDERIVFINAWNEWAEGAHLEPDRHFGFAYLAETARALSAMNDPAERDYPALERLAGKANLGERIRGIGQALRQRASRR